MRNTRHTVTVLVVSTLCLAAITIIVSVCVFVLTGGPTTPKGDCGKKGVKTTYSTGDDTGNTHVVVICKGGAIYKVGG